MEINKEIKKLRYRLKYRGTKELDKVFDQMLLRNFTIESADLKVFKEFIEEPEYNLQNWLVNGHEPPYKYNRIINTIRYETKEDEHA